ncbi:MAG: molecular chaperone DnaK [Tissierella sp.]|nr:molecular chaperone DnaK [Tissierella sp.]
MKKDSLYFYNRLLEERDNVKKSLEHLGRAPNGSMDVYYSELSGYDNHPADMGTELFMKEQNNGMEDKLKTTMMEIEESFEDMNHDRYGICKGCHKEIKEERLELIPYLKTCLECSEELATPEIYNQRTESISENYFGTIKRDHAYFDGEATLQEVFQYNIVENDPSSSTGDNMGLMDEDNNGVEDVENISQEYYDETLR